MAQDPVRVSYLIERPEAIPTPEVFERLQLATEWATQITRYREFWRWYDGKVYAENQERFPLALNPVRTACLMHRNALFGETAETSESLARVEFVINPDVDDEDFYTDEEMTEITPIQIERRKRARRLGELVSRVWQGSNGRALMLENGLISQVVGGCAFAVRWTPWNKFSQVPISIEIVHPHEFLPVYSQGDMWHLHEAYVVRHISAESARSGYGVKVESEAPVIYMEHWTRDKYEIKVADQVPVMVDAKGNRHKLSGKNPFGIVPFVYIPHEREGSLFYGLPVMHQLEGLLLELNSRASDTGDAVRDGAHRLLAMVNVTRQPEVKQLDEQTYAIDLGVTPPNSEKPELYAVDAPEMPAETLSFIGALESSIRSAEFTPDVAYGKDEGSQRSGLTLAFRMWPLSSHIRAERTNWSIALGTIAEYIVRIAQVKSAVNDVLKKFLLTEDDFNLPKQVKWFPMLPRDEEAETNMTILRHQEGILSTETAVRSSDAVEDPDEEIVRLQREKQAAQEQEMALAKTKKGAPTKDSSPVASNDTESF